MTQRSHDTRWRASGPYLPTNASKAGLLEETRQFLLTYAQLGDLAATRRALVDGGLPQRARETRITIVKVIQQRLTRWTPPTWVYDDLATFAQDTYQPSLPTALLLHAVRQDTLLYDFVQHIIMPRWRSGEHTLVRADVQRSLDQAQPEHPEIDSWSHATREKLAGNMLSILRDYGLLRGREQKQIVEPTVPPPVADHLVRLLLAEGVSAEAVVEHPDWHVWLWEPRRIRAALTDLTRREAVS